MHIYTKILIKNQVRYIGKIRSKYIKIHLNIYNFYKKNFYTLINYQIIIYVKINNIWHYLNKYFT